MEPARAHRRRRHVQVHRQRQGGQRSHRLQPDPGQNSVPIRRRGGVLPEYGTAPAKEVTSRHIAGIAGLAAVGLATAAFLVYRPAQPRAASGNAPYYKRTGFLSKLLMDLD